MKLKSYLVLSLLLVALTLTACAGGTSQTDQAQLENTSWLLTSYAGTPALTDFRPTLSFEANKFTGNAGCNDYTGSYAIDGDQIKFADMTTTKLFCMISDDLQQQESVLLNLLSLAERFELQDGILTIFSSGGETLLFEVVQ